MEIGSFIINILTTGMYPEPMDALREYVQNSYDAIRRAEKTGLLKPNHGRVRIIIDNDRNEVVIWDNGVGVAAAEARSRLMDIGSSKKILGDDAGFRGIGRLAGLAYADKVVFRSSADSEVTATEMTFDAAAIRKNISPGNRQLESAVQLVERLTKLRQTECKAEDHFFEVRLIGVDKDACPFLEPDPVTTYLRQVAPVEFDTHKFPYAMPFVNPHLEAFGARRTIKVVVEVKNRDEEEITKPYKTYHHAGTKRDNKMHVVGIEKFADPAIPPKWVGWLSQTKELPGVIGDEEIRGLRFRVNNILIGDHNTMSRIFGKLAKSNTRFNGYFSGEIHILHPDVIPNARRDYFEDTPTWRVVENELMELARILGKRVRDNEQARNRPTSAVEREVDQTIEEVDEEREEGFATEGHRTRAVEKLKAQEEKIEKAITSERTPEEQEVLRLKKEAAARKREEIEEKWKALVDESSLNKDQRKILRMVLEAHDSPHFFLDLGRADR
jgi:molecular chaperone HtpG